mmetsp:Transcript_19656/g.36931  ORF Transcript_19656/g.36931 Transcript_19656/m.36931 type:complete len:493 (-) Transcript_19656:67-1545(-)
MLLLYQRLAHILLLRLPNLSHPRGAAESHAGIDGLIAQLRLDPQELIVLGRPLPAARRSRLDLSRAQPHGQVGDVRILRLARSMGRHDAPTVLLGELDGVDRFRDGTDLIDLEEEAVGRTLVDGLLDLGGVGHGQIVSDHLHVLAHRLTERRPVVPVVLIERILDGHDGILRDHVLVELNEFVSRQELGSVLGRISRGSLEVEVVLVPVLHLELGRGHVEADGHLVGVPGVGGRLHAHVDAGLDVAGRGEAALVADECGVAAELGLDDLLEVVKDLAPDGHGLAEALGSRGNDEKFLKGELVPRVLSSVDDVEARDGEGFGDGIAGDVGVVLPERDGLGGGSGLGGGEGDSEDGVGAEVALVRRPVGLEHGFINTPLIRGVHSLDRIGQHRVDVLHGLQHALPHVPAPSVPKFDRLVDARGRSGRDGGGEGTVGGRDVDLDGRIAARVDDLPADDVRDGRHGPGALGGGLGGDAAGEEGGGLGGDHGACFLG